MGFEARHACVARAVLLAMLVLALVPAVASATPAIVMLRDGVDAGAKALAIGATPDHVYDTAFSGFSANLSALQRARLAYDPDVVLLTANATRTYTATGFRGLGFRGLGFRGIGFRGIGEAEGVDVVVRPGATPIEQISQIAPRGLRRVGGLETSVRIDGREDRPDVDIAVLDSGVQADQPDLNVVGGVNCSSGRGYGDVEGHGTIVAGVLAARDNAFGVVGVVPGARIWSVRVLDENLQGEDANILCGIDWVTAHADVIDVANLSLSGPGTSDDDCGRSNEDAVHLAVCRSVRAGVTYVAGVGNDASSFSGSIPAAFPEVISVSALADSDGRRGGRGGPDPCLGYADDSFAEFSNFGNGISLSAPGVCISSTYVDSNVAVDSGTSYATPFVAGAAALYASSAEGRRDLASARRGDRARIIRRALVMRRERTDLAGDPDGAAEGVLNVRGM